MSRISRLTHPDAATRPADEAGKPAAAQDKGTSNEKDASKESAEKVLNFNFLLVLQEKEID